MIHTFGCSFTKWHWPTWAHWLARYCDQGLKNHACSGFTNELIYYQLLKNLDHIKPDDSIYIMWTGNNRICQWYDVDYVRKQNCEGFFPDTQGRLWYGQKDWRGFYKTHPDHEPSLTHMIVTMFDVILRTQMLLDRRQCQYHMMFWQNPWYDVREQRQPEYTTAWQQKSGFSLGELTSATDIMHMPITQRLLHEINWTKFVNEDVNFQDPVGWHGLWEYTLASAELVMMNNRYDNHPNCLSHHDWVANQMLKILPHLRQEATEIAQSWQHRSLPAHDRINEIQQLHMVDQ